MTKAIPCLVLSLASLSTLKAAPAAEFTSAIPFTQLGTEADKKGAQAASSIAPTPAGARLLAQMQDIEAEATPEGLWLTSTAEEDAGKTDYFRVRAVKLGRADGSPAAVALGGPGGLPSTGIVHPTTHAVAWLRPGLVEEYRASTDGVRQDFVVMRSPAGMGGHLAVDLEITGAQADEADYGVRLTITATGRELAYTRLHVTDASGRELTARMEVVSSGHLRVTVQDGGAAYPVRIDPTFSDADWVALNNGIPGANNTVKALVVDGSGNLYAGGEFTAIGTVLANHVAKWNGSMWSALGSGMNDSVTALAVIGSDLYAGGHFTKAGAAAAYFVAKWSGGEWSALGLGTDGTVNALAAVGGDLYVGGWFTKAVELNELGDLNLITVNRIAKWNGSEWAAVGSGMNGSGINTTIFTLTAIGSDLYAGGSFTNAGGTVANNAAKWNGSGWSALSTGLNRQVNALAVMGGDLYAGGEFTTAGGMGANRVAKWNGSVWSAIGSGTSGTVYALAARGNDLYVGGEFTTAGGTDVNHIAKWNGSEWTSLTSGIEGWVYTLAVIGGDLYAGGGFNTAGGTTADRIAKWSGSVWSALGTGMDRGVHSLAVSGSDLYAGGWFTKAGGTDASSIAKWNGSDWTPLGSGINGRVYALAVSGGDLYAGGSFTMAGGTGANRVAKWNGSAWSALGSGMNDDVYALAVSDSDLYAGGWFTTAGGAAANFIARWNGSDWSPLGTGMNSSVYALVVSGSDLYAGGFFTDAGGVSANRIAKWNGSAWSVLGTGMNNTVYALAVSGSDLYAGGSFTMAGGTEANRIAKWNGSDWSGLGAGMNDWVNALVVDGNGHLFVGGAFLTAGTTFSPFIAQANLPLTALERWRRDHFGIIVNSGNAADAFDADADGLANLLEWACDSPPTSTSTLPAVLTPSGADLEFTYPRSVSALNAGAVFTVEWRDTLPGGSWSTAGVTQTILSNNGTVQQVKATLPAGSSGKRFVRLKVTAAP